MLVLLRFLILGWLIYETLDPDAWSISKYRKFSMLRRTHAICAEMHHDESHFRPFEGQLQQWRSELQGKWPQQWLYQTMSSAPSTKRSLLSSLWVCPRPRIKGMEDVVLVDAPSAALQTCKVHGTYCTLMLFIEGMSHSWIIRDRQPATIQHYSSSSIRSLGILGVNHSTENIQKRWKFIIIQSYLHPHSSRPAPNESQQKCRRKFELKTLQRNQLPPNRAVEMQEKQLEG